MEKIKQSYNNINKIVNGYRTLAIIISFAALLTTLFMGLLIYKVSQNKILIVDGQGDILSASKTSEDEVFKIEADNHIRLFYARYFSYNKENYKKNIESGLMISGKSAVTLYETMTSKGWFDKVLNNDLVVSSTVESIKFNTLENELHFNAIGTQIVSRGEIQEKRKLIIKGKIIKTARVLESNPHGLIIDNIAVIDNSIKFENIKNE